MDYDHDLIFGSFITPAASALPQLEHAAREADRVGLDLVTLQDHPYNSGFLDTVTLIGHLAARTEHVRFAGNVLNLPLRPPAMLAKQIATIDRLSGGRVELGLGAGAFWDAIEAYGAPRLTPGQAVDALREAIPIIRALWGQHGTGSVRFDGTHYRVAGARPGPAPAHQVSIWVGAFKPRMLELVGGLADGWLLSLGRMTAPEIDDAHRRIDDAAQAAGRDPREVRRLANVVGQLQATPTRGLLHGPAEQWIDQLVTLALGFGFSGFVVAGDDTSQYDAIANDVIPAVREAVARERRARSA
ncbi:MAG: monooxygenase [Microbacterium sp. 69-7]|jgi:alkanesulfonate monooxygenase SsuD/methylene tetrahydromethanopterin reductase-like flavin-dependent oxidoreductase (luciferase family)|uniref:LLM class flavin-dependent oxidoreductase n=1 Tax=unclassified Microbacterium TaxID=2609290 RepID=UPI0008698A7C|nr:MULTISPECIES: LLM class flavin-dependent oxidoreductase [unclassified Microbacterium]ODT24654.1 MAG: 5,10-methylene tetrahydromethanopterin reductase [Microbacterium sp. SCN 69-37]OJU47743.1 MAG: monooxygenase [Microbacterium sp. 69-7]